MENSLSDQSPRYPRHSLPNLPNPFPPIYIPKSRELDVDVSKTGFLSSLSKGLFNGLVTGSKAAVAGLKSAGSFLVEKVVGNGEQSQHINGNITEGYFVDYYLVKKGQKRKIVEEPDVEVKRRPRISQSSQADPTKSRHIPLESPGSFDPFEEVLPAHSNIFQMPFSGATQMQAIINERFRYSSPSSPFRRSIYQSSCRKKGSFVNSIPKTPEVNSLASLNPSERGEFLRSGAVDRELIPSSIQQTTAENNNNLSEDYSFSQAAPAPSAEDDFQHSSSDMLNTVEDAKDMYEFLGSESVGNAEEFAENDEDMCELEPEMFPSNSQDEENDDEDDEDNDDEEEHSGSDVEHSGDEEDIVEEQISNKVEDGDEELDDGSNQAEEVINEVDDSEVVDGSNLEEDATIEADLEDSGEQHVPVAVIDRADLLNVLQFGTRLAEVDTSTLAQQFIQSSMESIGSSSDQYQFEEQFVDNVTSSVALERIASQHDAIGSSAITIDESCSDSFSSQQAINGSLNPLANDSEEGSEEDLDGSENDDGPENNDDYENSDEFGSEEGSENGEEEGENEDSQQFPDQVRRSAPAAENDEDEGDSDDDIICDGVYVSSSEDMEADEESSSDSLMDENGENQEN